MDRYGEEEEEGCFLTRVSCRVWRQLCPAGSLLPRLPWNIQPTRGSSMGGVFRREKGHRSPLFSLFYQSIDGALFSGVKVRKRDFLSLLIWGRVSMPVSNPCDREMEKEVKPYHLVCATAAGSIPACTASSETSEREKGNSRREVVD